MKKNKVFQNTLIIFLIGLFLRLFIMPFAMQADLLSMSQRAHLMTDYSLWGIEVGQLFSHYIYALNLILMKGIAYLTGIFPADFSQIFLDPAVYGKNPGSITSGVGDWLTFVNHPQINSFIFFLKMPHLLADIAVFWILAKIFEKNKKKNLILSLWFFNPVNIYAFYVFARHDAFTALALLLSILFLAKEKILESILAIFTAVQVRFQPLFYLPLFLIHWAKNFKNKKKNILEYALGVLIVLMIIFVQKNLPFSQEFYDQIRNIEPVVKVASSRNLAQKAFSMATSVGGKTTNTKLIIFIAVYALINLFYLFIKKAKNFKEAFFNLSAISYLAMALYFVFNDFSPHYFVWLSLFATICSTLNKKFIYFYLLSILGWGIMGLMHTGNFAINQNLFLPTSVLLFNTPQIGYSLALAPKLFTLGKIILNIGLLLSSYQIILYFLPKLDKKLNLKKILIPVFLLSLATLKPITQVQAAKYPMAEIKTQSFIKKDGELIATPKIKLYPQMLYRKTFRSPVDSFAAIDLKFDTSRSNQSKSIIFRIKKEGTEDWHFESIYNVQDFYNNAYYPFGFTPLTGVKDQNILMELQLIDDTDLPLYFYQDEQILSEERPTKELLKLVSSDLQEKFQTQKTFFDFWKLLLLTNLGALLYVIFILPKKEK